MWRVDFFFKISKLVASFTREMRVVFSVEIPNQVQNKKAAERNGMSLILCYDLIFWTKISKYRFVTPCYALPMKTYI